MDQPTDESKTGGNIDRPAHMLSFDVEEYFQVEAAAACGVRQDDWDSFPRRLGPCLERILELLAENQTEATFFVLGWVAKHDPKLIRRISEGGHEIASHGMSHRMITANDPEGFRKDLLSSCRLLEDICGQSVLGYRAPTFSLTHTTAWALDLLAEAGLQYDSSVFPIHHDRYGVPDAPPYPHRAIGPSGGTILEIPPLTFRLMGVNLPVGGGGYLRLLPAGLVGAVLAAAQRRKESAMLYLHPWELDPQQPNLSMSFLKRWRHRLGLHRTERKLSWLLENFRLGKVQAFIQTLNETPQKSHNYGTANRRQ